MLTSVSKGLMNLAKPFRKYCFPYLERNVNKAQFKNRRKYADPIRKLKKKN